MGLAGVLSRSALVSCTSGSIWFVASWSDSVSCSRSGACWYDAAAARQHSRHVSPSGEACLSQIKILISTVSTCSRVEGRAQPAVVQGVWGRECGLALHTLPMTVKEVAETAARQRNAKYDMAVPGGGHGAQSRDSCVCAGEGSSRDSPSTHETESAAIAAGVNCSTAPFRKISLSVANVSAVSRIEATRLV